MRHIKKFYQVILLILLILTPIFNIGELFILLTMKYIPTYDVSFTPLYIKAIKDISFILMLAVGGMVFFVSGKILRNKYYVFFLLCALFSMFLSFLAKTGISTIMFGIRWLMPMLVLSVIFWVVDEKFQKRVAGVMAALFIIGLLFQIYEVFVINNLVLANRNPGFFIMPTTMAMFSLVTMYYAYNFSDKRLFSSIVVFMLGPLSVFLAGSGTGMLSLVLFLGSIMYNRIKQKKLMAVIAITLVIVSASILPVLTSRKEIYSSLATRIGIFLENISHENAILSLNFGNATNTAMLAKSIDIESGKSFVADSTIVSIIYNTGMISLVFFVLFILCYMKKGLIYFQFLSIFFLFMLTNIIFETFPVNLLFIINMSYFYRLKTNDRAIYGKTA